MNRSDTITEIAKALAEIQKSPLSIKKDAENPHFKQKYATLHSIMAEVEPALTTAGLILIQAPSFLDGVATVTSTLVHVKSGEWISCDAGAPATGDAQKVGSAITYLRRYGISSLLSLVTEEDDDGNAAAKAKDKPKDAEKSAGKEGEETPEETDHRKRTRLWKIMLKMNHDITDDARKELKVLSGFEGKDGWVDGKETVADLKGQRLAITLRSAEKEYEEWKEKEVPAADPEQSDIEF